MWVGMWGSRRYHPEAARSRAARMASKRRRVQPWTSNAESLAAREIDDNYRVYKYEDGTQMVFDSQGKAKTKMSAKEREMAEAYAKKKSSLLCDKLEHCESPHLIILK